MFINVFGRRLVSAGLVLGLLACPSLALAQQQPSLAELARREQERRKAIKGQSKVYTDRDVKSAAPPPPSADGTTPLPPPVPPPAPVAEEQKPPDPKKDPAWWKGRMETAREELRRNEAFASALQTQINSLTNDFTSRDDPNQRAKVADDRQKALAEMDRVKGDIEKLKKQIADIEEEARKAGVPPGWVR